MLLVHFGNGWLVNGFGGGGDDGAVLSIMDHGHVFFYCLHICMDFIS
jgi:hypothetical protein